MNIRFNLWLVSDSPTFFKPKSTGCLCRMTELGLYLLLWRVLSLQTCPVVFGFVTCDENRLPVTHAALQTKHDTAMRERFVSFVAPDPRHKVNALTDVDDSVSIE